MLHCPFCCFDRGCAVPTLVPIDSAHPAMRPPHLRGPAARPTMRAPPLQLLAAVAATVVAVPAKVLEEFKASTPPCVSKCCRAVTVRFNEYATPTLNCAGSKLDPVSGKCASGSSIGYAACPPGTHACFLASWHRPLCAAEGTVHGVDSCKVFEALAVLHQLPKVACP